MAQKLAGKVAIVTGSSKGIGASIAQHLADEGASVVVNYSSSKTDAHKVVAEIVAPAVVFLASADSSWITGETLYISGGMR